MKTQVTITVDKDVHDYISTLAEKDARSLSSTINVILRAHMEKNKDKETTTSIL